jgi:hypothetical protein
LFADATRPVGAKFHSAVVIARNSRTFLLRLAGEGDEFIHAAE